MEITVNSRKLERQREYFDICRQTELSWLSFPGTAEVWLQFFGSSWSNGSWWSLVHNLRFQEGSSKHNDCYQCLCQRSWHSFHRLGYQLQMPQPSRRLHPQNWKNWERGEQGNCHHFHHSSIGTIFHWSAQSTWNGLNQPSWRSDQIKPNFSGESKKRRSTQNQKQKYSRNGL